MLNRKIFHDSVTPLPSQPGLTTQGLLMHAAKPLHLAEPMRLLFSLALPANAVAALEAAVEKGELVPAAELRRCTPKTEAVHALIGWLLASGYTNIEMADDRASVYAQAPAEQIERSLQVKMVRITKDGLTCTAAQNAPSLPAEIGDPVQAIIGLQPFRIPQKHFRLSELTSCRHEDAVPSSEADSAGAALATAPNIQFAPPYLVDEVRKAYGADKLAVTGHGQTIAILIDTVPSDSDVRAFWARNGIPAADRIQKINVGGSRLPAASGEETLDVEWASGIAADARIKVYASGSLSFVDLDKALDRILADAMSDATLRQVSISLGLGERYFGGPAGEIAAQHQRFLKLAALGVNVFVSSGDAGSNPDNTGHGASGPLQVEYESSDPCVVSVGGTSLHLTAAGKVGSEVGWPGSGGGKSAYFKRPAWQKGVGFPVGDQRLVPDVSLAADPQLGAFLVMHGKVQQIGGTSWSAPVWAGFCALINEARVNARKKPIGFLNPLLYPLAGTACFRDIKDGSNGAYQSGPGYDLVTGLGVPSVAKLIEALVNTP